MTLIFTERHITNRTAVALCLLLFVSVTAAAQSDFALKSGDRVVFFGDSITEQRLYTSYVQQFVISRYPELAITFINSGWGGDTVNGNPCVQCAGVGALARIERDVVAHKPTVVTLLFGMNDGLYQDFDPKLLKTYTDGLSQIIAIIKRETHARIYVMTPTVYDAEMKTTWSHTDKYNEVLDRYSEAAKEVARRESLPVIDLHAVTTAALMNARKADKSYTFFGPGDGVHPKAEGHAVMAAEIVRAWGAPEEGTVINGDVNPRSDSQAFSSSAPVPWPAVKLTDQIQKADASLANIGRVTLKLKGLANGMYTVSVDQKTAGRFSPEQLANGISIANLSDVAQALSRELAKAVRDKEDLEYLRWRTLAEFSNLPSTAQTQADLQKMTGEQFAVAREKAKFHKYEITLTKQESK